MFVTRRDIFSHGFCWGIQISSCSNHSQQRIPPSNDFLHLLPIQVGPYLTPDARHRDPSIKWAFQSARFTFKPRLGSVCPVPNPSHLADCPSTFENVSPQPKRSHLFWILFKSLRKTEKLYYYLRHSSSRNIQKEKKIRKPLSTVRKENWDQKKIFFRYSA